MKVNKNSRFHLFQSFQSPGSGDGSFDYTFGVEILDPTILSLVYISPPPPGLFPGEGNDASSPYFENFKEIDATITLQSLAPGRTRVNLWMYIPEFPMRDGTLLNSYDITVRGETTAFQTNEIGRNLFITFFILLFFGAILFLIKKFGRGNLFSIPLEEIPA